MKKLLKLYFSFTKTEKNGFIVLCSLLIVLIIVRATMSLWVHPATDPEKEKQLIAAWKAFKHAQAESEDDNASKPGELYDKINKHAGQLPDIVNINTADSETLISLKGIGPVTAHKIILRRNTKGPFTDIEQLWEVGRFSAATRQLLEKQIVFGPSAKY